MLAHPDRCVNCPALNLGSRVRAYLSSCQRRGRASDRHMRTLTQIPTLTISTLAPNQTIFPRLPLQPHRMESIAAVNP